MVRGRIVNGGKLIIPGIMREIFKIEPGDELEIRKNCDGGIKIHKSMKEQASERHTIKIPPELMNDLNIIDGNEVNIVEMKCEKGIKINKI